MTDWQVGMYLDVPIQYCASITIHVAIIFVNFREQLTLN